MNNLCNFLISLLLVLAAQLTLAAGGRSRIRPGMFKMMEKDRGN